MNQTDSTPIFVPRVTGKSISRRQLFECGAAALSLHVLSSLGCSPVEPTSNPRLTARPGTPTIAPTLGQTELGLGSSRDGLLFVPHSYSADEQTPLFIGLHGSTGDSSNWASYSARADSLGFVFLAIDSRDYSWDIISEKQFGPDVEFIDEALRYTFARCNIDPNRIALGGFSDGATYALSLGIANGDLFSHLIAYSPGYYVITDFVVGSPNIYISHGTDDRTLSFLATRDQIVPRLRESGYNVRFDEFDGGHEVPQDISENALDWFLAE